MDSKLEFAVLMRALAQRGLDDLTFLHCSLRTKEMVEDNTLLINIAHPRPFWATRDDDCVEITEAGLPMQKASPVPNGQFWIHRDIYEARPELRCILHVHTPETIAVASLEDDIRQLHQGAALFTPDFLGRMAYGGLNEYRGLVEAFGERRFAVLMEGHGAMVVGRTIGEAFELLLNLQDCCIKELAIPQGPEDFDEDTVFRAHLDWVRDGRPFGAHSWPAERDAILRQMQHEGQP